MILVLLALAFAVAWTLVKGSVRRAEERMRVGVSLSPGASGGERALKIGS